MANPVSFTSQAADLTLDVMQSTADIVTSFAKATTSGFRSLENVAYIGEVGSQKMLVEAVEAADPAVIAKAQEIRAAMGA